MNKASLEPQEVADKGEAIYTEDLRPNLETPENIGKIVVIDVSTGDYELGTERSSVEANLRLRQRRPYGEFYALRIGFDVVEAFGGFTPERTKQ